MFVDRKLYPVHSRTNAAANRRRVFTNSAAEQVCFEPAKNGAHRTEFAADSGNEIVDFLPCFGLVGGLERAHVVGQAGQTLEAAFAAKQVLYLGRGHLLLVHQIEEDARVELAAARAHRQAVECGEAHRRGDALAFTDCAHRRAVTQMRDHDPAVDQTA